MHEMHALPHNTNGALSPSRQLSKQILIGYSWRSEDDSELADAPLPRALGGHTRSPSAFATVSRSLSPRPDRFTSTISSFDNCGASFTA